MLSQHGNFVKCSHIQCEEYVPRQSQINTPLCSFHGTYNTTNTVTSLEMLRANETTEKAFYARCNNLKEQLLGLTAELKGNKMKHGKMIRWNNNFEMCSNCDDVTTFEAACEKCNCCAECSKKIVCSK